MGRKSKKKSPSREPPARAGLGRGVLACAALFAAVAAVAAQRAGHVDATIGYFAGNIDTVRTYLRSDAAEVVVEAGAAEVVAAEAAAKEEAANFGAKDGQIAEEPAEDADSGDKPAEGADSGDRPAEGAAAAEAAPERRRPEPASFKKPKRIKYRRPRGAHRRSACFVFFCGAGAT